ncbi:MAG: hypothetical protein EPN39_11200 [Chitinophagaceae bacterium]|nr:MAG: hypothetical protein EPN39_11200 [Chitinophagaceae bacterium]
MKMLTKREKLHQFIDNAEEKRVKAIYDLSEDEIEEMQQEYSEEFKAELDKPIEYSQSGGKMVSPREMGMRLGKIRQKMAK